MAPKAIRHPYGRNIPAGRWSSGDQTRPRRVGEPAVHRARAVGLLHDRREICCPPLEFLRERHACADLQEGAGGRDGAPRGSGLHTSIDARRVLQLQELRTFKSVPADGPAKCFGFVRVYDTKPKRRRVEVLPAQGMPANQQLTFLTDGADNVRDLPLNTEPAGRAPAGLGQHGAAHRADPVQQGLRAPRGGVRRQRRRPAGTAHVVLLARQRLPRSTDRRGPRRVRP